MTAMHGSVLIGAYAWTCNLAMHNYLLSYTVIATALTWPDFDLPLCHLGSDILYNSPNNKYNH